jgi:fermentation-respiration switch protein FrsA (DUF1100 family)
MKQFILISTIFFVTLFLLLYFSQRSLIYYPSQEIPQLINYQAVDMQIVSLPTQDGLILRSWYKPAIRNLPTILFLHGNAGHIGNRMPLARQLMDAGFGLLLLEYRGYGGNKGRPTEKGLYEDGRAGMKFLHQQGIKQEKIVLYGESLGSGVATKLALENSLCAVVLQSPYTSFSDLARYHYPWTFFKPWDRFDSIDRIQAIATPLLIVHGRVDEVVPYSQGLKLFQQAPEPKKMISFEQQSHNDIWGAPGFADNVSAFIKQYCQR